MRKISLSILVLAAVLAIALMATAQEKAAPTLVGPDKCKMCHKDIYTAWEASGHAKAFTKLSAEEQKKAECVGCHVTGADATGKMIEGVTCESCHGAGSEYKSPKIMTKKWKDDVATYKKAAMDAGLVYPTAELCTKCHKAEGNANFKGFDFEKAKALVHPVAATTGAAGK